MSTLKVLCVHGVGRHAPGDVAWQDMWRASIRRGVRHASAETQIEFQFVEYDHLFERDPPNTGDYLRAVQELLAGRFGSRQRALARGELAHGFSVRWTAGMVAQWVTDDRLRRESRDILRQGIADFSPDVIAAHSLGSLVAYDTLRLNRDDRVVKRSKLITLGSQIGNPFVLNELGGRIAPLTVDFWYHLFNPHDIVFTAPIRIFAENFEQILAEFGGWFDFDFVHHEVEEYLGHENVLQGVWRRIVGRAPTRALRVTPIGFVLPDSRPPDRKALLVGINEYPNPADRLEGCINDAYRLSAALQDCRFEPEHIRLVLNDRATADGIRERLAWLLDGVQEGDIRFFGYSGHGGQIPTYGPDQEADGYDECLLPWDFDWSRPETLLADDWVYDLYAQLPYGVHFVMFLDCCHSGGLTRSGAPKVRMISPPDDVRHRALRWDRDLQMWVRRDLPPLIPVGRDVKWNVEDYVGSDGATRRFGRATMLRRHDNDTYDRLRREYDHNGPYLPMILQACQEHQVAFEYHDGAAAYGAFTFCFTKLMRDMAREGDSPTFDDLCRATVELLKRIGYDQEPLIVGPDHLRKSAVPFGPEEPPNRRVKTPRGRRKTRRKKAAKRRRSK